MNYLKNLKWEMILYSLISIVLGILMWIYPAKIMNAVCIALAVNLFIMALRYFIEYMRRDVYGDYYRYRLVVAILLLAGGIFILSRMDIILSLVTYIVAIIIIINGLLKVENALDLRRMHSHWVPLLVFAIICIVLGVSVLMMPMNHNDDGTRTAGDFMIQCAGVIFAITGLVDFITTLAVSGKIKIWNIERHAQQAASDIDDEDVIDVEYEDVSPKK